MTVLGRLIGERRASPENPQYPLTSQVLADMLAGPASSAGPAVTPANSLAMPAVWRAVNILAGTIAGLPLKTYRSGTMDSVPHPLMAKPHKAMTRFEFMELLVAHKALWGNFFAYKARNSLTQEIYELRPIQPDTVKVGNINIADPVTRAVFPDGRIFQVTGSDGVQRPLSSRDIFHVPGFSLDGLCGIAPIALARNTIGLGIAAEEAAAKLYSSGNLMTGVLQVEQKLTEEQAEGLASRWRAKRAALASPHDIAVLGQGAKFQSLTMPNSDAQFIESRQFQVTEIARWFGLPSFMLNDTERSTSWGSGLEQMAIGFVQYSLKPDLQRIEARVDALDAPNLTGIYSQFKVEGLLRGDSAARGAFYRQLWELGALNANGILRMEDMPGIGAQGDQYFRPLNFGPLDGDPTATPTQEATA